MLLKQWRKSTLLFRRKWPVVHVRCDRPTGEAAAEPMYDKNSRPCTDITVHRKKPFHFFTSLLLPRESVNGLCFGFCFPVTICFFLRIRVKRKCFVKKKNSFMIVEAGKKTWHSFILCRPLRSPLVHVFCEFFLQSFACTSPECNLLIAGPSFWWLFFSPGFPCNLFLNNHKSKKKDPVKFRFPVSFILPAAVRLQRGETHTNFIKKAHRMTK